MIKIVIYSFINFSIIGGILLDQLKLGENTYSEKFVSQLSVLQSVDLFVSHGG